MITLIILLLTLTFCLSFLRLHLPAFICLAGAVAGLLIRYAP